MLGKQWDSILRICVISNSEVAMTITGKVETRMGDSATTDTAWMATGGLTVAAPACSISFVVAVPSADIPGSERGIINASYT